MLGSISKTINIIIGVLIVVLVAVSITFGCLFGHTYNELIAVKTEAHHLSQTVQQLQDEEKSKLEIMDRMQERLKKAEEVKDYQEARRIWLDVWLSLESR